MSHQSSCLNITLCTFPATSWTISHSCCVACCFHFQEIFSYTKLHLCVIMAQIDKNKPLIFKKCFVVSKQYSMLLFVYIGVTPTVFYIILLSAVFSTTGSICLLQDSRDSVFGWQEAPPPPARPPLCTVTTGHFFRNNGIISRIDIQLYSSRVGSAALFKHAAMTSLSR